MQFNLPSYGQQQFFGDPNALTNMTGLGNYGSGFGSLQQPGLNAPSWMGESGGLFGNTGIGMNLPTLQFGLGALSSLGSLYNGLQANKLARDQFNFTKDMTNTNLNNSIKSYNTALSDRAYARAAMEGRSADSANSYIDQNRLSR